MADGFGRNFLLLQGPHGPFFRQLGQLLEQTGAAAWRVGFNGGDAFFWDNKARFIAHTESLETWPAALRKIIAEKSITDIVLYGDTRPVHAEAIKLAKALDLRVHVFEEGYLRPYWVNYERGGANGNSRLMGMTVAQMQKVLRKARIDLTEAPAHWGDIRQHAFYSFVYHLHILLNNRAYPNFKSHRADTVAQEFRTYVRRVLCHPIEILKRQITTRRIKNSGQAYHLVLMQLETDQCAAYPECKIAHHCRADFCDTPVGLGAYVGARSSGRGGTFGEWPATLADTGSSPGPFALWRTVCDKLLAPFLFDPAVHESRAGHTGRRVLLHGKRCWPFDWNACVGTNLSHWRVAPNACNRREYGRIIRNGSEFSSTRRGNHGMTQLRTLNGAPLSSLCFGTMQFGGTADADMSLAMYDACRKTGVNHFDTAHVYTGGASETLLGQFIKNERENIFVATKVAYTGGAGKENINATFAASQIRLQLDCVDLLYLHRFDDETPLEETFEALARLQQLRKIRHIGVSNYAAWQVVKAQTVAAKMGTRINMIQPMYSLVKRQAEVELLPMAQAEGIGVATYSPLGAGLLTGKNTQSGNGRLATDRRYAARYGQPWMHKTAKEFATLAAQMQVDPATLGVAWAAYHPSVSCPIISARTVDQLRPSLAAAQLSLSAEQYACISALSPTPAPATDRLEELS